ncbi:MAG: putative phage abortive infection protein [Methylococcales bacterium]
MIKKFFDNIDSNNLLERLTTIFYIALGFIFTVFVIYFYWFNNFSTSVPIANWSLIGDKTEWGQFGDFFGGTLNPLLSFLGLIALLCTLALQSKELSFSKRAQDETKKLLDEQYKTQLKQQFENTFFSLLDQHNRILERLLKEPSDLRDIAIQLPNYNEDNEPTIEKTPTKTYIQALIEKIESIEKTTRNERSVEIYFKGIFQGIFHSEGINVFDKKIPQDKIIFLCSANLIIKEREKCAYYFLFLYQLLKFIATNISADSNPFEEIKKGNQPPLLENEKMYSNIVRSLLTNDITFLLVIMCYCQNEDDDYWKYKLLIERYALFEHISWKMDWDKFFPEIKKHYDKSAFGNSPLPSIKKWFLP